MAKEEPENKFEIERKKLIAEMLETKDIDSRLKMFLFASIDELRKSTEKSSKVANRLFIILIILTGVLAFGTIVGLI